MKNFIEPQHGTKIAEYKMSWFKHFIVSAEEKIYFLARLALIIAFIYSGISKMINPTNPIWLSWTMAIILCVLPILYIWYKIDSDKYSRAEPLRCKSYSIFVVKDGIEINNRFIPFKEESDFRKGYFHSMIESFKIDSDFLLIKTRTQFISIYGKSENEIKFKIDPKYLDCKDELLSYLNNQIEKSEAIFEEKKKKKKKKGIDIVGDYD
jgi:hypothetical protein